jgi:hypothetical protein
LVRIGLPARARGPWRQTALCIALLAAMPLALLWPSLFAGEVFLPFSAATFPPFAAELSAQQRQDLAAGANLDVTEVTVTFCPEWELARAELARGMLPHWNPGARFGASLLATSVVGLLYPPNWLTFLPGDPQRGLAWNALFTLLVASVLMFGLLRALGLSLLIASFGALAFAWSGTLSANLHFYQRMHSLIWLPGLLWALLVMQQRGEGRARAWAGVGLALGLALTWLAGFPAYAAAMTLVAAGYGGFLVAGTVRQDGVNAARRLAVAMAICALLGLALACVQLLPMFAFFPESNREPDPSRDAIANQAFDPMGLLGYALPYAFGSPVSGGPPYQSSLLAWSLFSRASWDNGIPFAPNYNYIEYAVFPGTLTLLLALGGALAGAGRGRLFAVIALGVLWLLAVGTSWFASVSDLPFVRSVPPMRFMGPACVLVAWLAALGGERMLRGTSRWPWRVLGAGAALLAVACFVARTVVVAHTPEAWLSDLTPDLLAHYGPRFPHATPEMVRILLGGEQLAATHRVLLANLNYGALAFAAAALWSALVPWAHKRGHARTWLGVALLATAVELFAVAWPINRSRPHVDLAAPALTLLRTARREQAALGGFAVIRATTSPDNLPRALPPGLLVPDRIRDLHAYTFVDSRSHQLFRALYGPDHMLRAYWPGAFPDDARLQLPLWDALGVRHVLATTPLQHAGTLLPQGKGAGEFYVYERTSALARAFVVPALHEVADDAAVVAAMIDPAFAPRARVVVTTDQAAALRALGGTAGSAAAGDAHARAVTFRVDTPTEVVLEVAPGPAGFLVLSDTLMSGWTATIDGVAVPIARGNLCMRVLPVSERAAVVRFAFATPRLGAGAAVTVLAALGLALWTWWCVRRQPRVDQAEQPEL